MPTSPPGEFTPQQACPGWLQGNCSLRWSRIICKCARAMTLPVLPSVTLCLSPIPSAIIKCLQHRSAGTVQGSKGYSRFTANEPWGQAGEPVPSRHQKWEKMVLKLAQNTVSPNLLAVLIKRNPGQICSHFSYCCGIAGMSPAPEF